MKGGVTKKINKPGDSKPKFNYNGTKKAVPAGGRNKRPGKGGRKSGGGGKRRWKILLFYIKYHKFWYNNFLI